MAASTATGSPSGGIPLGVVNRRGNIASAPNSDASISLTAQLPMSAVAPPNNQPVSSASRNGQAIPSSSGTTAVQTPQTPVAHSSSPPTQSQASTPSAIAATTAATPTSTKGRHLSHISIATWVGVGMTVGALIVAIFYGQPMLRLARWTALRDFRESCMSDRDLGLSSDACNRTLARASEPPPIVKRTTEGLTTAKGFTDFVLKATGTNLTNSMAASYGFRLPSSFRGASSSPPYIRSPSSLLKVAATFAATVVSIVAVVICFRRKLGRERKPFVSMVRSDIKTYTNELKMGTRHRHPDEADRWINDQPIVLGQHDDDTSKQTDLQDNYESSTSDAATDTVVSVSGGSINNGPPDRSELEYDGDISDSESLYQPGGLQRALQKAEIEHPQPVGRSSTPVPLPVHVPRRPSGLRRSAESLPPLVRLIPRSSMEMPPVEPSRSRFPAVVQSIAANVRIAWRRKDRSRPRDVDDRSVPQIPIGR